MVHLWVRAEQRANEQRTPLTPAGAAELIAMGFKVTVEDSPTRCLSLDGYRAAGCEIAPAGSWIDAPAEAFILGLKELPDAPAALKHRHIFFGHAFKGQPAGRVVLERLKAGGGALYDLEYLVDETGRRVAAFGYWAGFAGAWVALKCWAAQQRSALCGPVDVCTDKKKLLADLQAELSAVGPHRPKAIVIGALGRVGSGATDLLTAMGVAVTRWDMAETASGGPFPDILHHDLFLNCILAGPKTPVFVYPEDPAKPRRLTVIGDIACDPESDFNPIKVYDHVTDWDHPAVRVAKAPVLDVTAIDNLPSLLPLESSEDFASQLLPHLKTLGTPDAGVWGRAAEVFKTHTAGIPA
ncbi:saccharopine dehydrogenase [Chachezhania sediminis]|uniref:saccharopine dehydrogenase n=1 Tax=Chachezhania sediminis TaxID=2599291 RepID=UPI00131C001F|nr:saccharopine dehydrogenase [Chachezhania sediminis]